MVGRAVIPGFVDSHAHLVFAGDRAAEFAARMTGTPYAAGGIRTTVAATRAADDDQLRANVRRLVHEMARQGTTTVECKTGYGLTIEDELRALRIAKQECDAATFLGAHVVPAEYADLRADYVDLVRGPMLDACAEYADYVDVFCERGAYDEAETRLILDAAKARGIPVRLHANQLGLGPGVQLAVEYEAASADHCTYLSDKDIEALAGSETVATLLPGVEFSTRSPYPDARSLLDAGAHGGDRDGLQSRILLTRPRCRSASRSPSARCTCPQVRRCTLRPSAGAGAAPHRHRPPRGRGPRRFRGARRAEFPAPRLPAGRATYPQRVEERRTARLSVRAGLRTRVRARVQQRVRPSARPSMTGPRRYPRAGAALRTPRNS